MNYFKQMEFWCKCGRLECTAPREPNPELLTRLNILRTLYAAPLIITSGNRCKFWNKKSGGKDNSEHLTGEGADLKCLNSTGRYTLLECAMQAGFTRLGVGEDFVHVGVSKELSQKVIWTYYPQKETKNG